MSASFAAVLYLVSGVLFILALRGLSSPETSRKGNLYGMVGMALAIATVGYVLETGRIVRDGPAEELREDKDIKEFYLGIGGDERRSFREVKSYRRKKRWSA